jgi:hypothetical protein
VTGTDNQISWADIIRVQVNDEFDRVSKAIGGRGRPNVLAILEDKRREVLANQSAGYFIKEWGELNGQVRRLIMDDPRYSAKE